MYTVYMCTSNQYIILSITHLVPHRNTQGHLTLKHFTPRISQTFASATLKQNALRKQNYLFDDTLLR